MKVEAIWAYAGGRKLWLGCVFQMTEQSAKYFAFNARFAAWRILKAKNAKPSEWRR